MTNLTISLVLISFVGHFFSKITFVQRLLKYQTKTLQAKKLSVLLFLVLLLQIMAFTKVCFFKVLTGLR